MVVSAEPEVRGESLGKSWLHPGVEALAYLKDSRDLALRRAKCRRVFKNLPPLTE